MDKTKGNFFNKKQLVPHSALPPIKWVRDVCILGVNFGSEQWENQQWDDKFMEFKKEIGFFKTKNPTLDAKSMLSKFKLGSFFSYISQVFPVPTHLGEKDRSKYDKVYCTTWENMYGYC